MESANHHLDAVTAHNPADINGARELVALDTDQTDQAFHSVAAKSADQAFQRQDSVDLVVDLEFEINAIAKHLAAPRIQKKPIERGGRICGNPAAPPLDDVTLVVIVGGLDQRDQEFLASGLRT
jgi:hypothetical protein